MNHPLDGIRAKIEWADQKIRNLNDEISTFLSENRYSTITKSDPKTGERVLYAVGIAPPIRFAIVAGEIIHHLRSCLDHLVWQLVLANGKQQPKLQAFPVASSVKKFKEACDRGYIKGISGTAQAIIERLQPYHCKGGYDGHWLWVLHRLDATDKHQVLLVVIGIVHCGRQLSILGKGPLDIKRIGELNVMVQPSEAGTEILRVAIGENQDMDMDMEMEFSAQVVFDQFGPIRQIPVIQGLQILRDKIVGAIAKFNGEFA